MALIATFTTENMTEESYATVLRKLAAIGAAAPVGRMHHTCFGDPAKLQVVDVFDTPEHFDAFGKLLLPILTDVGVRLNPPAVGRVHNIIRG